MNRFFLALTTSICCASINIFSLCVAQVLPPTINKDNFPIPKILEIKPSPIQKPIELLLPDFDIPSLTVRRFIFKDNKAFSSEKLESLLLKYLNRKLSYSELREVRDTITNFYINNGYVNSGAALLIFDNPTLSYDNADVYVRVIEGRLRDIKIEGSRRLSKYIKDRLIQKGIFNYNKFSKSVLLLQDDPLLSNIQVSLERSDSNPINILDSNVKVKPAKPYHAEFFTNNYRNPSIGSFERGIEFTALNPLSLGDKVNFTYRNTNGSNFLDSNYTVPITKQNTTLRFSYLYGNNEIIEEPFNGLSLNGISQIYSLAIRHPLFRSATEQSRSEFALGVSLDHLENQDKLLGFNFPVSRGSDNSGQIKTTVLRFTQEWQYRDVSQFTFLRSQFSLGLDIASISAPVFDNGQFFSWRGDAVWNHKLPGKLVFVSRYGVQFSDRPLIGSEQLSAGGETNRGYRQDGALGDNGFLGSLEVRIPIFEGNKGRLNISPFFDVGYLWNNELRTRADLLASVGLSLQYNLSERLSANFTWGIPLTGLSGEQKSLQEQGFLFSLRWLLF
jgi:hemolysin activation/secretion protein